MQNQIPEAAEVTLIDGVKGERVGVMPLREARAYAKEARCILKCVSGSPKPVFKTVTAAEVEALSNPASRPPTRARASPCQLRIPVWHILGSVLPRRAVMRRPWSHVWLRRDRRWKRGRADP